MPGQGRSDDVRGPLRLDAFEHAGLCANTSSTASALIGDDGVVAIDRGS